ncbi:MAG TPA: ATP-binding protein, partial [Ferruginibacter sp.]|nr:ATP-binding protein [Ferruginibacter sp.]HNP00427.1 ATP-binding protein [Ferruginibacter sp.]
IKHAEAKNITISLTHTTGSTRVIISDDGKGFDVNKKRKGVGISNMINRAESFNGQVDIKSETGKGTRITITIPD